MIYHHYAGRRCREGFDYRVDVKVAGAKMLGPAGTGDQAHSSASAEVAPGVVVVAASSQLTR